PRLSAGSWSAAVDHAAGGCGSALAAGWGFRIPALSMALNRRPAKDLQAKNRRLAEHHRWRPTNMNGLRCQGRAICGPLGDFHIRGTVGLHQLPVSVTRYTSSPRTRAFTIPASSTLTVS